jgi:hypothetical protein
MTSASSQASNSVTIVRSHGRRLAKLVQPNGAVVNYDSVRAVDLFGMSAGGLGEIEELLRILLPRWDCAVVRGAIADPARTSGVRRLLYADRETGEPASLIDVPRSWVALDTDGLAIPADCDAADLRACAAIACAALPAVFRNVTMVIQATSSHAIKPGAHLRMWFWLSRPTAGAELKIWLKGAPVDPSVFNACQLIYTAVPLFAGGGHDPMPERLAVRFGAVEAVPVPDAAILRPPPLRARPALPLSGDIHADAYATTVLAQCVSFIMTAPIGGRHAAIVVCSRRLAELEMAGLLAAAETDDLLIKAAKGAGIGDDGRDVDREVAGILRWARRSCGLKNTMNDGRGT